MGASITPENLTVRYATPPNSEPNLTTIDRLVLIRMRRDRVAARMLTREVQLLLIEPRGVRNTGDAGGERTAENNVWI